MAAFSGGSGVIRPGRSPSSCWRDAAVQVGATVTTEFGAGWVDTPASGTPRARWRTAFHAEALALWYVGPTVQALHATPNLPARSRHRTVVTCYREGVRPRLADRRQKFAFAGQSPPGHRCGRCARRQRVVDQSPSRWSGWKMGGTTEHASTMKRAWLSVEPHSSRAPSRKVISTTHISRRRCFEGGFSGG